MGYGFNAHCPDLGMGSDSRHSGYTGGAEDMPRPDARPGAYNEAEAQRRMVRGRRELQKEIRRHCDRIRKLLHAVWGGAASDESLPNGWRHSTATAVKAGESRPQQTGRSASADTAG